MDEHFHESRGIPKARIAELMRRSDGPALLRFSALFVLSLCGCAFAVHSWGGPPWQLALSQVCLGLLCCSLFAAEHETVHSTAFKSPWLNKAAAFLAGVAHVYPSTAFRELHFAHHRHTHVPGRDPEISLGPNPAPSVVGTIPMYLAFQSGLPLLLFKLGMLTSGALGMPEFLRARLYPFVRPEVRLRLALESLLVLAVYGATLLLALRVHPGFWGLLTGQVVGHCLLATYVSAEHNGLPHNAPILDCTRSMRTNRLVKLLMWNMPYHGEHHAYPAVPFHALPALHRELREEIRHKDLSHPEFHLNVLLRRIS
jgi:fatty acid desaturase